MQVEGDAIEGLEHGNAWALRNPLQPATNWLVGDTPTIPTDSLRFLSQRRPEGPGGAAWPGADAVHDLAVKWFLHRPDDDPAWGEGKPLSSGRTLSLLAGHGAFEIRFRRLDRHCRLLLDQPGDFAIWGAGLEHSWRALEISTVLTLRWATAADPSRPGGAPPPGPCPRRGTLERPSGSPP